MKAEDIKAAPAFDLLQFLLNRRPRHEVVDIFGHKYEVREVSFKDRAQLLLKDGEEEGDYVSRMICATVFEPWPSTVRPLTPEMVELLPMALANTLSRAANRVNLHSDPLPEDKPEERAPEPLLEETEAEKNA